MIYLDQAATTMPKPPGVYRAVLQAMRTCASVGRSGHAAAMAAAETVYNCRKLAAELFDTEAEQVVFTGNATHSLNLAIHTLVGSGDRVVISGFEHNAVVRPLHHIGARVEIAGRKLFDPADTLADFEEKISSGTKAVICTHVSNAFGYILPLYEISEICRTRGVPLIIDAAQSAGVLPISMKKLHAAFIAMPGHKGLYGPQGTGILLCGQVPAPLLCGGTGSRSYSPSMPDFLPDAAEAGTHNVPGIAGLQEGIRFVRKKGVDRIREHEYRLLSQLKQELLQIETLELFCADRDLQTGVLSLRQKGTDCELTAQKLADAGIASRAGLHCAPLAHESAGTLETGTVRFSLSAFNTMEDIRRIKNFFL